MMEADLKAAGYLPVPGDGVLSGGRCPRLYGRLPARNSRVARATRAVRR
jgi:hypothetical protein